MFLYQMEINIQWTYGKRLTTKAESDLNVPREELIDALGQVISDAGDESAEISSCPVSDNGHVSGARSASQE